MSFFAIVANTFGWIAMFALAAGVIGLGLYAYRAWRGTTERGVSPTTWLSDDAWATPTRSVLATLFTIAVIVSVFIGSPTWVTQLILAAIITATVGMAPPAYRGGAVLTLIVGALPFVAFVVATLMSQSLLVVAAATLITGALLRALLGVPDSVYYGQASSAVKVRHMIWPGLDKFRECAVASVQGQSSAIIKTGHELQEAVSVFSPYSKRPVLLSFAGPESCGRRKFAEVIASTCQGRLVVPNERVDVTGEAFYAAIKSYRVNGEGCVIFLDGVTTSPKGQAFLADVALKGHPDGDDWSKAVIIVPVDVDPTSLPANGSQKALIDALAPTMDRRLLGASTIIPMAALDAKVKGRVAAQVIIDLGRTYDIAVGTVDGEALFHLVEGADHEVAGAGSVHVIVEKYIRRKFETAQMRAVKKADVAIVDGEIAVIPT